MRNVAKYILRISIVLPTLLFTFSGFAQDTASKAPEQIAPAGSGFVFDINAVLAIVAILLFVIVCVLGITLKSAMELYSSKNKPVAGTDRSGIGKIITIAIGLLMMSSSAFAQVDASATATEAVFSTSNILKYILFFIIFMELVAIFAIIKWLRFFTGIEEFQTSKGHKGIMSWSFGNWWRKINKIRPIKDEADIDIGHNYDGIRELDNVLPPWFTWSFIGTIVFGIIYMWRFHVAANPAPDQYQEYEHSIAQAKIKLDAYLASKGEAVDETNVTMLGGADVESGKTLFTANCVACHGSKGEGGVGPNLTDEYWLHGGSINDIFKIIKLGVVEKGMQSWKDVLSATQIAQLSSYIKSIHGTHPPGAKAPQGDVYNEAAATPAPADSSSAPASGNGATAAASAPDSAAAK